MADKQITVRDGRGASLVLEYFDNGQLVAWIAPPGDSDGPAVALDDMAIARLAQFFGLRHVHPVVDADGDDVWLRHDGWVQHILGESGFVAPDGWRRLYVEPATGGDSA
jgi:hypothetical protein